MLDCNLSKRALLTGACLGAASVGLASIVGGRAFAQAAPGKGASRMAVADSGRFDADGLISMERGLYALPTTSLLIYDGDRLAYQYGNGSDVSYLASARKSILSMLYGKYVEDGTIDLDSGCQGCAIIA